jgi:hypothetical protein
VILGGFLISKGIMAYSRKTYPGDGSTKLFTVTFPYIDRSHVKVYVNGVETPVTWPTTFQIEFATAPGSGAIIQLVRDSNPAARLVDFQDDSMATEALFDLNSNQLLFIAQEAMDKTLDDSVLEEVEALKDAALAAAIAAAASAASITLPLPIASGGLGSTTVAGARTALGLGTSALKNVGVAAGEVIEVQTGGKLPALSAQDLTNIPRVSGTVVQTVYAPLTTLVSGTTLIPLDDTVPQSTEGFLVISQTFTPTKATNKLRVEYVVYSANNSTTDYDSAAVFVSGSTDALASSAAFYGAANVMTTQLGSHDMVAGTTSSLTFSLRVGPNSGTTTFINGRSAGLRVHGGALHSFLRITEYEV